VKRNVGQQHAAESKKKKEASKREGAKGFFSLWVIYRGRVGGKEKKIEPRYWGIRFPSDIDSGTPTQETETLRSRKKKEELLNLTAQKVEINMKGKKSQRVLERN